MFHENIIRCSCHGGFTNAFVTTMAVGTPALSAAYTTSCTSHRDASSTTPGCPSTAGPTPDRSTSAPIYTPFTGKATVSVSIYLLSNLVFFIFRIFFLPMPPQLRKDCLKTFQISLSSIAVYCLYSLIMKTLYLQPIASLTKCRQQCLECSKIYCCNKIW